MTHLMIEWSEDNASDFIVGTCQLIPKSYSGVSDGISIHVANILWRMPIAYSKRCGSSEEFYIRPLNSSIDDTDELVCWIDELALVEDLPVLPHDVSGLADTIKCYKIEPYLRYPGFVRLRIFGKTSYNWKLKKYEFSHASVRNECGMLDNNATAANIVTFNDRPGKPPNTVRGPAITFQDNTTESVDDDKVQSVWCPQWPGEAQDWPKRPRNYGWPTTATISEVVQHGCHVVYVQHRACRDDAAQWRYSFSVAEVILLQSWTKVQQIVYNLFRFFAKRELMHKDCPKQDEVLCSYHLKTLMLWTCEQMSPEWWNSSSVIAICCDLLKILSQWLKKRHCPNYFIPEANLFHEQCSLKMCEKIERQLDKFCNSRIICHWYVENYILPYTRKHIRIEFTRNTSEVNLMEYLTALFKFRKANKPRVLELLFSTGFTDCNYFAAYLLQSGVRIEPRSCLRCTRLTRKWGLLRQPEMSILPMPESVRCFTYFDIAVFSLHAVYALQCGQMLWDSELFAEYVNGIFLAPKIVRCQYHIFPKPLTAEKSKFQFLRVQDFMEDLTGSESRSEYQLLSLVSKELIRKALECDDSQSNSIAPAALVYLAALHFATSKNQIVIDLCSLVLMDETTDTDGETLNAGCLFFIDDVVRIVGFCLLCNKVNKKMQFSKRQIYLDLRLTPKVFAYYMTERISEQFVLNLSNSGFPLDQLFLVLAKQKSCTSMMSTICFNANRQCVYRRKASLTENANLSASPVIGREKIIDALMEFALENMASFYRVIRTDFGIQCNTVDCYRALYLYSCRHYDEVLHVCEQILNARDLQSDLKKFAFANVLVLPVFDCFFDEDVQSLLGFHALFFYLSPLNDDFGTFDLAAVSTIAHCIAKVARYWKNQPLNPIIYKSIKYSYFLGRHFLARYLKLRCCIDCNHPGRKAMAEFVAMKIDLPFEHIIRRFILRKLQRVRNNPRVLSCQ